MDWNEAIEKNREALKRILAALVAMAGLGSRGQFTFFPREGAPHQGLAQAEKSKLSPAPTLPRHLHRAVLRLLRPAESAARRLVIVAARGIVVVPPRPRQPGPPVPGKPAGGIMTPGARMAERPLTLPLLDPLRLPSRRRPVASGVPRISVPGYSTPFTLPPPPSPDDPVDAARLGLRLAALASALDNLPAHARRFARWRVRRDAAGAQDRNRDTAGAQNPQNKDSRNLPHDRPRRVWPLRPGRPPGWRRRPEHEVHEVLNTAHGLAFWALQRHDTS